ncbi:hypothetical protein NQ315_004780 [Exocentrus adspersus]|uniref:Cuticle protein 6 n=1 Tax=Exocentrus adspersus TaxID=1586481 RepID=A0AAV8W1Y7_9CUCU|nr:hypothetical protein NQ315_004780 [Exocentrus adspersus]
MKLFIVCVLAAVATAEPSGVASPLIYSSPLAVAAPVAISSPVSTQYHAQDELGQYSYGYSNEHSAKSEARSVNGVTIGGYTYVDPAGKLQKVEYSSDPNGFRVAASNLPVPPAVPSAPVLPVPVPVQDTPEVVEARTKHLEALEAAKVRASEVKASLPAVTTVVHSISPVVATAPASVVAGPLVATPLLATRTASNISTEIPATPSSEAPTTSTPVESTSVSASAVESKSAGAGSETPAGVSILSTPTVGLSSLIAPAALPVGISPFVSAPTAYAINSLHPLGFSSIVAQPAVTSYTAQFLAPLARSIVQSSEGSTPTTTTNAEHGSE